MRSTAGLATAATLTLFGANVAMASDPLPFPGIVNPLKSTSVATEPDLAGPRFSSAVTFKVKDAAGAVVCWGKLEQTVIRSTSTHYFHFYYRIRTSGGTAWLDRFTTPDFGFLRLSVAYLRSTPGPLPPRKAFRNGFGVVRFVFADPPLSCARHDISRYMLIKPNADQFYQWGMAEIMATTGAIANAPTPYKP